MPGLRFFAAKAAAHAAALHPNGVVVNAERMRHPVLNLAGVLRACINQPLVLLLRQHIGHLAFQIKMFLSADFECAVQNVPGSTQRLGRVTAFDKYRWQNIAFGQQRVMYVKHSGQGLNMADHFSGSAACLHHRPGHYHANHLADMLNGSCCKNRFVMGKRGQHCITRNISRQHHIDHTGHGQRCCVINAKQLAVGSV